MYVCNRTLYALQQAVCQLHVHGHCCITNIVMQMLPTVTHGVGNSMRPAMLGQQLMAVHHADCSTASVADARASSKLSAKVSDLNTESCKIVAMCMRNSKQFVTSAHVTRAICLQDYLKRQLLSPTV